MGTTRRDGRWLRRIGRGGVAIGMIVALTGFASTAASAPPGQGNNGTVKVDEQGLENGPGAPNSNDPHIDCVGRVEWYGFDPGVQSADVLFEVQAPTSNTGAPGAPTSTSYANVPITDGDGPGGTSLDGTLDFDLSDLLFFYAPHPQQGFHVKVTVHTTFAQGSDVKHKVFWVDPCPAGSLSVDKAVTGAGAPAAGTQFSFTVDCHFNGNPVDLNGGAPGAQASFTLTAGQAPEVLTGIPTGSTCTVTETSAQGAASTTMTVNGGAPVNGTTASGLVIGPDGTTVTVLATNDFPVAPPNPTFGSLSVDKVVTGDDPQDPALLFSFTADCTHNSQPVDLNGGSPGTQASFTLTAAQAAHLLSSIPTGAVCSVTETGSQGADATSMTVDGGAPTAGTTVSGIVIGNATTVAVVATNTFNTAGGVGPVVVTPPLVTPPVVTPPEVLPEVIVPPVTPPVVAPEVVAPPVGPTEVEGAVIPRQLPRTGTTTLPLVQIGLGLVLLGIGALLFGRERTALI